MAEQMTSKELAQAGSALVEWFNSQEISSVDAERIMSKVSAKLIAKRSYKAGPQAISDEVGRHNLNLVKDLADALYALGGKA